METRYKFRRPPYMSNSKGSSVHSSPNRRELSSSSYKTQLQKHRRIMTEQYPVAEQRRPAPHQAVMKSLRISNPFKTKSHIKDLAWRNRKRDNEYPGRQEYYNFTARSRSRDAYLSPFDENRSYRNRNEIETNFSGGTHYTPYIPAKMPAGNQFFPEIFHPNVNMSPSTYYYLLGQCNPATRFQSGESYFPKKYSNYSPQVNGFGASVHPGEYAPQYQYQRNGQPANGGGEYGYYVGPYDSQTNGTLQYTGTISHQFQSQPSQQPIIQDAQPQQPGVPFAAPTFTNQNQMNQHQQQQPPPHNAFPPIIQASTSKPSIEQNVIGYESEAEVEGEDQKPKTIKVRGKDYFLVNLHS